MNIRKISIIGANLDTGNMGVGALMIGAITCIKHAFPQAEVSLIDYDDYPKSFKCNINGSIVPVNLVPLRFSKQFYLSNNIAFLLFLSIVMRIFPFKTLEKQILQTNMYLSHLHDSDMVLSIAGGDSFSDIYGMGRFIYIALPQLLTIAMGKKLIMMPQTIGPFKSAFVTRVAAFILKHAHKIYCRELDSLAVAKLLIGKNSAEKVLFSYDMGFVLEPVKPEAHALESICNKSSHRTLVGLNISGLLCIGGYNRKNMFSLKTDYSELIRSLIPYLITEKDCTVVLVPHVFGEFPESDIVAAGSFFEEFKSRFVGDLFLANGNYNQNEIKYIIGKCDFFIGSRMHACIAALSQNIPAIGIAYSRKFSGVMSTIGAQNLIADPCNASKPDIIKLIGKALDSRDEWKQLLQKKMPEITSTVLNILKNY